LKRVKLFGFVKFLDEFLRTFNEFYSILGSVKEKSPELNLAPGDTMLD
jgi:hypothetical protein